MKHRQIAAMMTNMVERGKYESFQKLYTLIRGVQREHPQGGMWGEPYFKLLPIARSLAQKEKQNGNT